MQDPDLFPGVDPHWSRWQLLAAVIKEWLTLIASKKASFKQPVRIRTLQGNYRTCTLTGTTYSSLGPKPARLPEPILMHTNCGVACSKKSVSIRSHHKMLGLRPPSRAPRQLQSSYCGQSCLMRKIHRKKILPLDFLFWQFRNRSKTGLELACLSAIRNAANARHGGFLLLAAREPCRPSSKERRTFPGYSQTSGLTTG